MSNETPYVRPSRVTIPKKAHPAAKLVFHLMQRWGKSYDQIEYESGVLKSSLKAYRGGGKLRPNTPSLTSIEALLGVFGYRLVPCPPLDSLPSKTRAALDDISLDFLSDDEALAAAIVAATSKPGIRAKDGKPAPPMPRIGTPYWLEAA